MKRSDGDWVGAALSIAPVPTVAWAHTFEDRTFFGASNVDILVQKGQHSNCKSKVKSLHSFQMFPEFVTANQAWQSYHLDWYQIVNTPIASSLINMGGLCYF